MGSSSDTATLFAGSTVTAVAAAIAMLYVWRVHGRDVAVRYWALGFLISAASTLFLVFRGQIPLTISIFGANYLGAISTALLYIGTARFLDRKVAWGLLVAVYVPSALALAWWTLKVDLIAYRNLAYTVCILTASSLSIHILWLQPAGPQRAVFRFVALCMALLCSVAILRATVLLSADPGTPLTGLGGINTLWVLNLQAVMVLTCMGYLLMNSQRLQLRLDDLANKDELTGLYNRRAFRAQAQKPGHGEAALLVLDLDNFKTVNDVHGHATGDLVLREFAATLQPLLRPQDLLARAGGEEFWLLLPGASAATATQTAERLRAAIAARELHTGTQALRVTVSIGLALQSAGDTLDAALARADQALYAAKTGGRNRVVSA